MYDIKELGMVPPPFGGVSVYLRRLIEMLSKDGYSVGGYYMIERDNEMSPELFDRWSWLETYLFPVKIFRFIFQMRKYRIIHSHLGLEAMVYLWTIKKVLKKKIVITIHNSMVKHYYDNTNMINKMFLRLMAEDNGVCWIAVSEEGRAQMESLPVRFASTVYVIPAYIPAIETDLSLCESMDAYLSAHSKNLAFYGHSFMTNQGEDIYGYKEMLLIFKDVKARYNNVGLVYCIADISDENAVSGLLSFAQSLDLDKDIYWQLGSISNMALLWERIDVYVRPTSTDGDSVSIREALESGAQVVASAVCKRPEQCYCFPGGDVIAASNAILDALTVGRNPKSRSFEYYLMMQQKYHSLLES